MKDIATVGLDLAKSVFQVHAISQDGEIVLRKTLRRGQVLDFFKKLSPCLIGMEACGGAHYWAREIAVLGHNVRIMPPAYVKPYVKRNKTDAADAEAICEAVTRPTMRFVPIKSAAEQASGMAIKTRDLLLRQRTQITNALRAHMAELGIVAPSKRSGVLRLKALIADEHENIPAAARLALSEMAQQLGDLSRHIEELEKLILADVKEDDRARRLMTIPGVGPITAATVKAVVPDPIAFRTARNFAAWLGLTPKAHSSGGKERLGSISKRGNQQLRTLMITGATAVLKMARHGRAMPTWITALLARRPFKVVAVALANKIARVVWALSVKGGTYEIPRETMA